MPSSEDKCTFGAVGDIVLARTIADDIRAHGSGWPMEKVLPVLRRADVLFGNMESVVLPPDYPDGEIDPRGMVTKLDGAGALAEAGFSFMNLAGNHVLDGGEVGMFHTREVIEAHGIVTGGVGRTQCEARELKVVESKGLRFGFLCYAEDSNYVLGARGPCHAYYTRESVLEDIERGKDQVDVLVVSVHGDLEFVATPAFPRREAYREFARAGATLVLHHHPHVPQGVERIDNSLIAYSLGNFCFHAHTDRYVGAHLPEVARSFVLLAEVTRAGVESFQRVPVEIRQPPDQRPFPMSGKAEQDMLERLAELDRMVADDEMVQRNWRETALRHLEMTFAGARHVRSAEALRFRLARLFLVAENRSWADEVLQALQEEWSGQQAVSDPYHRPSHRFMELQRGPRRGIMRRLASFALRPVRALKRRLLK